MFLRQRSNRNTNRHRMAMNTQQFRASPWFVQHNVIRLDELSHARHVDSNPQYIAPVHSVGIRVLHAESGYACAGAVEVLLFVCTLRCGCCEEGG